ncbi:DUF1641 domain-containing protein [Pullulanibacillus sp. KACC 23026]|uniref:DUF1641 domain-containing protein n=1 Tax=Pullulanibacillus sp. KACC 23026 TaxID=3028315 RepID=UPI0023AEC851|nr:DUF1641 domain-containing protein [Pullulanibacillus sp. KACC 23026]WEG12560.1 DUF1641 domain-containing protein [Pullulanibacillus sp. KACC 23026]
MAKAISFIKKREYTAEEEKAERLEQITDSVSDNGQALDQTLRILAELHESGILDGLEAALKAKGKITEILLGQATRKEVTNMINNVMGAAGVLAAIDPEQTTKLLSGVAEGLSEAGAQTDTKVSAFGLLKALRDPDINRAISFGLSFMKGLGKSLKS